MPKQPRLSNNTEAHLQSLGIRHQGYEHFAGEGVDISGLPRGDDYRWLIRYDWTAQEDRASTLVEALGKVKAAIEAVRAVKAPAQPVVEDEPGV